MPGKWLMGIVWVMGVWCGGVKGCWEEEEERADKQGPGLAPGSGCAKQARWRH